LSPVGWNNCPDDTRHQVHRLVSGLRQRLGSDVVGIYLHGSLALGCFNLATSDIDLLAVTKERIPTPTKKSLVELLLVVSGSPHPVEISFLNQENLVPWQHPTPFDLHYSEHWRQSFSAELATGRLSVLDAPPQTDPDLAAHITVTRRRGITLWGKPIHAVFPQVPREDFLAAIISDLKWAQTRLGPGPGLIYGVLNSCRVCAFLREGHILSKDEGAIWALSNLPPEFCALVRSSLETYRGERVDDNTCDLTTALRLLDYVVTQATG
jgi:hypothetical protein